MLARQLRTASTTRTLGLAAILIVICPAMQASAQESECRTWTALSGHQVQAELIEFRDGQVKLKKQDGGMVTLAIDTLSAADRTYLCGSSVPQAPNDTSSPQVKVVATGVGIDGETALKNAFSNALEQAVGVLVDAETIIENDQIIRDQVLTLKLDYEATISLDLDQLRALNKVTAEVVERANP